MKIKTTFFFIVFTFIRLNTIGQDRALEPGEWDKNPCDPNEIKNENASSLYSILNTLNLRTAINFLNKLFTQSLAKNNYYNARFNHLKVKMAALFNAAEPFSPNFVKDSKKQKVKGFSQEVMQQSQRAEGDCSAAYVRSIDGDAMSEFRNTEKVAMYIMYRADLYNQVQLFGKAGVF